MFVLLTASSLQQSHGGREEGFALRGPHCSPLFLDACLSCTRSQSLDGQRLCLLSVTVSTHRNQSLPRLGCNLLGAGRCSARPSSSSGPPPPPPPNTACSLPVHCLFTVHLPVHCACSLPLHYLSAGSSLPDQSSSVLISPHQSSVLSQKNGTACALPDSVHCLFTAHLSVHCACSLPLHYRSTGSCNDHGL